MGWCRTFSCLLLNAYAIYMVIHHAKTQKTYLCMNEIVQMAWINWSQINKIFGIKSENCNYFQFGHFEHNSMIFDESWFSIQMSKNAIEFCQNDCSRCGTYRDCHQYLDCELHSLMNDHDYHTEFFSMYLCFYMHSIRDTGKKTNVNRIELYWIEWNCIYLFIFVIC